MAKAVGILLGAACAVAPHQAAQAAEAAASTVQQASPEALDGAFVHPGIAAMVKRAMAPMRDPDPWYQWTVRF